MHVMKCDRCGNYFDCNQLSLRIGNCSSESFGHISVRGVNNHCCNYDLCDDCVVDFFRWVNDPGKLMGGESANGQKETGKVQAIEKGATDD